jgi:hypothetical protein
MAQVFSCRLTGHLTRGQLETELARVPAREASGSGAQYVLLDCMEMVDYDLEARHAFVVWLKSHRPQKVAILTSRSLWRMVIQAMSMASKVPLQPFDDAEAARRWLLT